MSNAPSGAHAGGVFVAFGACPDLEWMIGQRGGAKVEGICESTIKYYCSLLIPIYVIVHV